MPGTCTAVWWEMLQTGDVVFGIPQLGVLNLDGTFMENDQLEPDIKVANTEKLVTLADKMADKTTNHYPLSWRNKPVGSAAVVV